MDQIMTGEILPVGRKMRPLEGETFDERLAFLQERYAAMSEAEQRRLWKGFGGEARMSGAYRGIIGRSAGAIADLQAAEAAISAPTEPALAGLGAQFLADLRLHKAQVIKEANDILEKAEESFQLTGEDALTGVMREHLPKLVQSIGWTNAKAKKMRVQFEAATIGHPERAAEVFQRTFAKAAEAEIKPYAVWQPYYGPIGYAQELPPGAALDQYRYPEPTFYRNPRFRPEAVETFEAMQHGLAGLGPARPGAGEVPGVAGAAGAPAMDVIGQGGDQRAEQRHAELVGAVNKVADAVTTNLAGARTDPMPERPER